MIEVKLVDITVNDILALVDGLRARGYKIGKDFDFEYHAPKYDDTGLQQVYTRYVIFTFYKEELASWFSLMYQ